MVQRRRPAAGHVTGHVGTTSSETEIQVKLRERSVTIGGLVRALGRPLKGARILPIVNSPVHDEQGRPLGLPRKKTSTIESKRFRPTIETSPNRERDRDQRRRGTLAMRRVPVDTPANWPVWLMVMHPEHVTIVYKVQAQVVREFLYHCVHDAGRIDCRDGGQPIWAASARGHRGGHEPPLGGNRSTADHGQRWPVRVDTLPRSQYAQLGHADSGCRVSLGVHRLTGATSFPPQVIRLTRRRPLEGRVVDDHGNPVAASVRLVKS